MVLKVLLVLIVLILYRLITDDSALPKLPKLSNLPKFTISAPNHTTLITKKNMEPPMMTPYSLYIGIGYSITTNG